jgi:hypothetical protein
MTRTTHLRAAAMALAMTTAAGALPTTAGAQRASFTRIALAERALPGLAVTGTLSDLAASSRGSVTVPATWRRTTAAAGRLRFVTTQNSSCRYTVSYAIKSVLTPEQDAAQYAAARLPAESSRHLLDSGERGSSAFRVVRRSGIGGRVRVNALWVGVLTKRDDVAPDGKVARTEISVSAISRAGDECHAGTWRESLGPAIGDSLAVARTKLHFTKKR